MAALAEEARKKYLQKQAEQEKLKRDQQRQGGSGQTAKQVRVEKKKQKTEQRRELLAQRRLALQAKEERASAPRGAAMASALRTATSAASTARLDQMSGAFEPSMVNIETEAIQEADEAAEVDVGEAGKRQATREKDPVEKKVTKGVKFVNLEVEGVKKLQTGLQEQLNQPFYKPDKAVLKKQMRLQRGKGDFGITQVEAERFDVGMVLDVPVKVGGKEEAKERRQVDIGLPVNDAGGGGEGDAKGGPADDEAASTPELSVDGDAERPAGQAGDAQDGEMKKHLEEMEKKLD